MNKPIEIPDGWQEIHKGQLVFPGNMEFRPDQGKFKSVFSLNTPFKNDGQRVYIRKVKV